MNYLTSSHELTTAYISFSLGYTHIYYVLNN